jgi:GDPmannose 4,6-dehydratase
MSTKVLITGISGQDGSFLAELLLDRGYEVYGLVRRSSTINTTRIDHLLDPVERIHLIYGDLTNDIESVLYSIQPDVIYNLAAMSHVRVSFDTPAYTFDTNAVGPIRILEAIRTFGWANRVKYYNASSSEIFGSSPPPQDENTPFCPCSPYGIAKLASHWATKIYRDGYNMFASNGILFNHSSERRGETFVTKKVVRGAVRIKLGKQQNLVLGNLDSKRDFGHSRDYCEAMIKIMEHDKPDDFVVSTGKYYSIREFVDKVFIKLGLDYHQYVLFDKKYLRPKEVNELLGVSDKIRNTLGWEPKIDIDQLIDLMVQSVHDEEKL